MEKPRLSESQEDYLKEIFKLREMNETVSMQDLARKLDVRPPSVTGMIKKLCAMNLVEHEPYKGVQLTETGEKIALEVLRHHRLLELYLARHLNYSWDEIHEEAERLEHVISEKFEAAIADLMDHPTHDPHGDPIPTADLEIPDSPSLAPLPSLKGTRSIVIGRVMTQDRDILSLLFRLELTPGQEIELIKNEAAGIRVRINGSQYLVPHSIARLIWCENTET
ncbi:MAG: metal-dependent transcriptional regulator [Balneolaceae bacterium]|nr:MAG: metal-dependent transcriptional regulator [Balneolaceae bacterium]